MDWRHILECNQVVGPIYHIWIVLSVGTFMGESWKCPTSYSIETWNFGQIIQSGWSYLFEHQFKFIFAHHMWWIDPTCRDMFSSQLRLLGRACVSISNLPRKLSNCASSPASDVPLSSGVKSSLITNISIWPTLRLNVWIFHYISRSKWGIPAI